ncbi:leucine rich repeat [Chlorella sorokiniana]|uniref:Leucine rich repeat n=1 Tax=Chlorella sorokiniana TaxID=3076 RepID=A0A2P6TPA2_CHLSO|nr:leucine rich repeat [Chlorella sorokiniana]|eukprot:PRW51167.1 leucine rich repeat [Chlorella sorokiniana]
MGSPSKAKKKPAPVFHELSADLLERIALLLNPRDRYKLNLVCRAWREGLVAARAVWECVAIDPRKKASTNRRVRFNKHLPTAEALGAYFATYGRHCRTLHLGHLDAASEQEGCIGEDGLAALLQQVAPRLQQLVFNQCRIQSLLLQHAPVMRSLAQLTSLHIMLPLDQRGLSLGAPETAFVSCLTRLEDLALASPWREEGEHFLPASLPPSLRSLQLARLGGERGVYRGAGDVYALTVASSLAGLSALQHLVLSDCLLMEQEPLGEIPDQLRMPPALFLLPSITSLTLNDVGLGRLPPLPAQPAQLQGLYPLPRELRQLAPSLRELALLQHCCAPEELAVLSEMSCLTALSLTARLRPAAVPDALSTLTGLRQLKISHGLSQVPPAIVGLSALTLLDLSYNALHSLRPGAYLKRLVAVNLRANQFTRFPTQLKVARHTAQELHLPQNDAMEISERDVEQLLSFECLKQLTIFGASEERSTQRCLAALQKAMPWLLLDV